MMGRPQMAIVSGMALIACASAAGAASYTGRKLLDALNDSVPAVRTFAEGYTFGIADSMQEAYPVFGLFRACIPAGTGPAQLATIVRETLQREEGYLHNAAGFLVAKALADAFPCQSSLR